VEPLERGAASQRVRRFLRSEMAEIEGQLEVKHCLVETSAEAYAPEGLYIAWSLFRDRERTVFTVLNATQLRMETHGRQEPTWNAVR
jgi:hypothetical protein